MGASCAGEVTCRISVLTQMTAMRARCREIFWKSLVAGIQTQPQVASFKRPPLASNHRRAAALHALRPPPPPHPSTLSHPQKPPPPFHLIHLLSSPHSSSHPPTRRSKESGEGLVFRGFLEHFFTMGGMKVAIIGPARSGKTRISNQVRAFITQFKL